jgi:hypothetical protein
MRERSDAASLFRSIGLSRRPVQPLSSDIPARWPIAGARAKIGPGRETCHLRSAGRPASAQLRRLSANSLPRAIVEGLAERFPEERRVCGELASR